MEGNRCYESQQKDNCNNEDYLYTCIMYFYHFEFTNYDTEIAKGMHIEYYKNLCLGMFASGLLVLIPAIVQYNTEKVIII